MIPCSSFRIFLRIFPIFLLVQAVEQQPEQGLSSYISPLFNPCGQFQEFLCFVFSEQEAIVYFSALLLRISNFGQHQKKLLLKIHASHTQPSLATNAELTDWKIVAIYSPIVAHTKTPPTNILVQFMFGTISYFFTYR